MSAIGKSVFEDNEGNPVFEGDTVIDENGNQHIVVLSIYREKYGCGSVVGYYRPDYCVKRNESA